MKFSITHKIKCMLAACLACVTLASCGEAPDETMVFTKPDTTEAVTIQTAATTAPQTSESTTKAETAATTTAQTTVETTTETSTETAVTETTATESATTKAPTQTETTASEPIATTETTEAATQTALSLISVTSPATKGDYATATVHGTANTEYSIKVYYSSGASKAKGLDPTVSGADGTVSWTWKVGVNTKVGTYRIVVSGGGETLEFHFDVVA